METKFTSGPWKWMDMLDNRNNPHAYAVWQDKERKYLNDSFGRKICHTPDGTTEENRANARLIAAAPELLEALQSIQLYFERVKPQECWEVLCKTMDAIKKAIGE